MPSDDIARLYNFTALTTIQSAQANAELNQLVTTMNTKFGRGIANTLTGNNTFSGANTFSGITTFSEATTGLKTDKINEYTSAAGVTIDSVLHKDGAIRVPGSAGYTPATNGDFGYDSTANAYKGMVNSSVVSFATISGYAGVKSKSASYTAVAADTAYLINCTSTFTLALTAAATLGSTWFCYVRNDGTGIITIDPNASETIDGQTTIPMYPGETLTLVCDGSNFKALGRQRGLILLQTQTASNVASVDFTSYIGSDFDEYVFELVNVLPATNGVFLWLRVSEDGGSTWKSGAGAYKWSSIVTSSGGTTAGDGASDTKIVLGGRSTDGIRNTAESAISARVRLINPSGTTNYKHFAQDPCSFLRSNDTLQITGVNSGAYIGTTNAINAVQFLMSSGNIASGKIYLYGVRK